MHFAGAIHMDTALLSFDTDIEHNTPVRWKSPHLGTPGTCLTGYCGRSRHGHAVRGVPFSHGVGGEPCSIRHTIMRLTLCLQNPSRNHSSWFAIGFSHSSIPRPHHRVIRTLRLSRSNLTGQPHPRVYPYFLAGMARPATIRSKHCQYHLAEMQSHPHTICD